jgi:colanic acid/amylovoran biosynthesis glycosyltransferase
MPKEINIGLVLPAIPGYSETFFHTKINGLINHGFKVSLFVSKKGDLGPLSDSVSVYSQANIRNKLYLFITLISSLTLHPIICFRFLKLEKSSNRNWLKAIKNLIINSHIIGKTLDWIHFGFATSALGRENLAYSMSIKAAVSLRGFDIGLYPHQHLGCYNLLWEKIDKVHTISDDLYNKALQLGLKPKTPFEKITPAININIFKTDSFNDLHEPLRILTVGRLHWKKGYEYALKALNLLKEKKIDFEYHIVGEGNYRESILFAVNQLELTNNVILNGQLTHEETRQQMEWADVYIQPSIQEGFCNSVLEAQAMGLLCIVTNAEGLSENVKHSETGWVINKRSAVNIVDAIINIISLKIEDIYNIRGNAISHVRNTFNLDRQIKKFIDFYV